MSEPIYHANKQVITADEAAEGFKLLDGNVEFAFVQTSDENKLSVIPVRKKLKISGFNFQALDFLKFREGVFHPGKPWQFLMILNGLHKIEILEDAENITFEKMPEVDWKEIIPSLKDMLMFQKSQLLKTK